MDIGTIMLIVIFIILIMFLAWILLCDLLYENKYKIPSITQKIKEREAKKDEKKKKQRMKTEIKNSFNKLIHLQNIKISDAMKHKMKYAEFIFVNNSNYKYPIISYIPYDDQYMQIIIDMAKKYYKRYKIDGDKIS